MIQEESRVQAASQVLPLTACGSHAQGRCMAPLLASVLRSAPLAEPALCSGPGPAHAEALASQP